MSEPDLSTLPQRMRWAAEVIEEARGHDVAAGKDPAWWWSTGTLSARARDFEAEDSGTGENE